MGLAYLSLGSNMGDRELYLLGAVHSLHRHPQIRVLDCSAIYVTAPVGFTDQPDFLNMAIALATTLSPHGLLSAMQDIEQAAGRIRTVRWGPRTLDLDLLWMDGATTDTPELMLPHPRMWERAFVLIPLLDIIGTGGEWTQEFVEEALEKLDGKEDVTLWKKISWLDASEPFEN